MWRYVVSFAFMFTLIAAVWIYYKKDQTTPIAMTEQAKEPRLLLQNFSFYRYQDQKIDGHLEAESGALLPTNVIEIRGNIVGMRVRNGQEDRARAQSALVYLSDGNLSPDVAAAEVEVVHLKDSVTVNVGRDLLRTEYAKYEASSNVISSDKPVHVDGQGYRVTGADGFDYSIDRHVLQVLGKIVGVVDSNEKRTRK